MRAAAHRIPLFIRGSAAFQLEKVQKSRTVSIDRAERVLGHGNSVIVVAKKAAAISNDFARRGFNTINAGTCFLSI